MRHFWELHKGGSVSTFTAKTSFFIAVLIHGFFQPRNHKSWLRSWYFSALLMLVGGAACSQASAPPPDVGGKIESDSDSFCDYEQRCHIGPMQTFDEVPLVTVTGALRSPDNKDVRVRGFLSTDFELTALIVPRATPGERDEAIPISDIPSTDNIAQCMGIGVELHGVVGSIPSARFGPHRGIVKVVAIRGIECENPPTTLAK